MTVHERFDRYITWSITELGTWEPFETELVQALLEPGDVFVDIGANIGWYTLVAALRVGPEGRVFAFEPDAENHAILSHNVDSNLNGSARKAVRVERRAVSDRHGAGRIFLSPDNMGDHRIYASSGVGASMKIRETRLDRYFRRLSRPLGVLKVDTQGAEPQVYRGGRERLLKDRPILVSEFWPFGMDAAGHSPQEVLDVFAELDAGCFIIDNEASRLRSIDLEQLAARCHGDLRPETEHFVDLVVVPDGHAKLDVLREHIGEPWQPEA